jgi:hypothetical protein
VIVGGWDGDRYDRGHYGVKLVLPSDEDQPSYRYYDDIYSDTLTRTWEQSFAVKVVGVANNNLDSSNRQESEEIILKREPDNPNDKNAIGVFRENGEMIGYLEKTPMLAAHMDKGGKLTASISQIICGSEGTSHGYILKITKNVFDNKIIAPYNKKKLEIDKLIKKAQIEEKNNPDNSIIGYKNAIEGIIALENEGSLPRMWREVRIPINRLTLLLERKKDYVECMKYLKWYESFDDRRGILNSDLESLRKRQERVNKALSKTMDSSV